MAHPAMDSSTYASPVANAIVGSEADITLVFSALNHSDRLCSWL